MIPYDIVVTAVSDRADLFAESMGSLLANVDQPPRRLIVHEDARSGVPAAAVSIFDWLRKAQAEGRIEGFVHRLRNPAGGMGEGVLWCVEHAATRYVLFTQEDWLALRPIPVTRTLRLMEANGLHHVRWNKRKTMPYKGEGSTRWNKIEVSFDDPSPSEGETAAQTFCIADHWYTQASMWRVEEALPGIRAAAAMHSQANSFVSAFNHWMNVRRADGRPLQGQSYRHEKLRTYIYGGIGEPPFVHHLGSTRGTGHIVDHYRER